jgi:glycosyltransferase involved in cell wall biosynthesis
MHGTASGKILSKALIRVSIIISNYNYERYVGEAIRSALDQDADDVEVIVVDDGSIDSSIDVIRNFAEYLIIISKENGGQASALNAGLKVASGDYVIFLDSDDVLLPYAASEVLGVFEDSRYVKAHWPMELIDQKSQRLSGTIPVGQLEHGDYREFVFSNGPTILMSSPTSGNAWSRSFLDTVFPIPEECYRLNADKYLFELAPFFGAIARIDRPLSLYRKHTSNGWHGSGFNRQLERELEMYAHYSQTARNISEGAGYTPDMDQWVKSCHWKRLEACVDYIEGLSPEDGTVIVADGGTWAGGPIGSRKRRHFPEVSGHFGGLPADSAAAIVELKRMLQLNVTHLVFPWSSFWWLDYYSSFRNYLDERYKRENFRSLIVSYDLHCVSERLLVEDPCLDSINDHP